MFDNWEELENSILNCDKCNLCKSRKNIVFGVGNKEADILFIGKDATVDHIKNLRRIISAYLSSAYGYSEKDADTLAVFITVYNAVYRGQYDVYNSKYKAVVVKNLSQDNCRHIRL